MEFIYILRVLYISALEIVGLTSFDFAVKLGTELLSHAVDVLGSFFVGLLDFNINLRRISCVILTICNSLRALFFWVAFTPV